MAKVGGASRGRRGWAATLVAIAALAFLPAPGEGAEWTPALELSSSEQVGSGAQIGVDAIGDVTVAWIGTYPKGPVESAYLPAGGTWGPTQTPISTTTCEHPSLAVNPAGAALIVADCGSSAMRVAYRASAGGPWESATELPGSANSREADAAIDETGNAIVVWDREDETVASAYRPRSTGTWGSSETISAVGGAGGFPEPRVAMSPGGLAIAAWSDKEGASTYVVEGKLRASGAASTWGSFRDLSPTTSGAEGFSPEIATQGEDFVVAWAQRVSSERLAIDNAWGTGGWGEDAASHMGGTTDRSVEEPAVALDGSGRSIAIWRGEEVPDLTGEGNVQSAATPFINGGWASPATVPMEAGSYYQLFAQGPDIAADPAGNAAAIWPARAGVASSLYAATAGPGGALGGTIPISNADGVAVSAEGQFPSSVAMDPGGDSFATWSTGGSPQRVAFAMRDGSPPKLSGLVVPVSGATGKPVAMSATASDVWSPPTSLHWDFGDGSSGGGASVSHTYAAPGTYTVTVTASDAQGNVSAAQTRQIAVTGSGGETKKPAVVVHVSVAKQTWKAIAKARAIKVRCGLDVSGTCAVAATLSAGTAKALGLRAKGGKPVSIGRGSLAVSGNGSGTVKVKLTKKALEAIGAATKSVSVALTATGSAPGHRDASKTKKLKIKRP